MYVKAVAMELSTGEELIRKAQRGDEVAFNQLVNLWYKRIYNYVLKYSSQWDSAADITQRTFISVFQHIQKLQEISSFKPWLYRIATNFCHEEARKRTRQMHISSMDEEGHEVGRAEAGDRLYNPEQSFRKSETEKILLKALKSLPEDQRIVIVMKEYEGFKFHEIAETLEASENTVKTRLYRGLRMLKKILEDQNITRETISYEL
ncbi:MAG: sigma-70 family RNA polymerase sigma factor [Bacteroidota bacterium]